MDASRFPAAFDEESFFDAPPPRVAHAREPSLSLGLRTALAAVGVGLLALVVLAFDGPGNGTWAGFLASFGLVAVGGSAAFWLSSRDRTPGVENDGVWYRGLLARGAAGWIAGIAMTGFYVLVYWFPAPLGARAEGNAGLVRAVDPLARLLTGEPAGPWFLYGTLYTLAIGVFGVRMWMKYRHNRYHQIRTASVFLCQLGFAFVLPNLLARFQGTYYELNGVWPLKFDYLWPEKVGEFWDSGAFGVFLIGFGLTMTFVATPILTYFYGKRWYCSWVCGCGGLAETLGDPWRQLSDKSPRAWRIERWSIHSVLVLVVAVTLVLWLEAATGAGFLGSLAGPLASGYWFFIGAIFSGVAGVGFYPLLGNRLWCRFGCPMAAYLGLWQRLFSRFRITTNGGQCMSCGNCSTYCEMGIDVRAYAQTGENIVRSSCVGCGVCAAVCPRGVLRLENGTTSVDRFAGAEAPLSVLRDALRAPDAHHGDPNQSAGR